MADCCNGYHNGNRIGQSTLDFWILCYTFAGKMKNQKIESDDTRAKNKKFPVV
jgi:hypothetical protein